MVVVPDAENNETMPSRVDTNGVLSNQMNSGTNSTEGRQMLQLDQLLEQVKSLKLENSNLKNELSNNTSQICRLESEASNLKEMVMKLGSSINTQTALERSDLSLEGRGRLYGDLPSLPQPLHPAYLNAASPSYVLPQTYYGNTYGPQSMFYPVYNAVPNLQQQKTMLLNQRQNLLQCLQKEERTKDSFMHELEELNKKLKSFQDTPKSFPPSTESTQQQLEQKICQIKSAMEKSLGTPDMMDKRMKDLVAQLKYVDQELKQLHCYASFHSAQNFTFLPELKTLTDYGVCEQYKAAKGRGYTDAMVQTGKCTDQLGLLDDKILLQTFQNAPLNLSNGGSVRVERYVQTSLTCLASSNTLFQHQASISLTHKNMVRMELRQKLELLQNHCKLMKQYLQQHSDYASHNKPENSDKSNGNHYSSMQDLQMKIQVSDALLHYLDQILLLSLDPIARGVMNQANVVLCLSELIVLDRRVHAETSAYQQKDTTKVLHAAAIAVTNLSNADKDCKALLMDKPGFLEVVVEQLGSKSEEIQKVMARILCNLSMQADPEPRATLRQKGAVRAVTEAVIKSSKEETTKSLLGALWHLSGHSQENKADICAIEGSLEFIVSTLSHRGSNNNLAILESGGRVLRNVSSVIAVNDEYRKILRKHNCLQTLVKLLISPSLTIVGNTCSTLWNLSARDSTDQQLLRDLGAVAKLERLRYSKHQEIAQGSVMALRNLLQNQSEKVIAACIFPSNEGKASVPMLPVRKVRQLESELKLNPAKPSSGLSENFVPRHHPTGYQQNVYSLSQGGAIQDSINQGQKTQTNPKPNPRSAAQAQAAQQEVPGPSYPIRAWEPGNPITKAKTLTYDTPGYSTRYSPNTRNTLPLATGPSLLRPSYQPVNTQTDPNSSVTKFAHPLTVSANRPPNMNPIALKSSRTWGQVEAQAFPANDAAQRGEDAVLSPSKMPVNLEEKLRLYDEEYDLQEDSEVPVDYSKKFTDEQSQTPAIQSPRSEQVYQFAKSSSNPKLSSLATAAAKSSAHASMTFSHSTVTTSHSGSDQSKSSFSGNAPPMFDSNLYEAEDTPTNFGAIYSEEHLFNHITNECYEHRFYPPPPAAEVAEGSEWTKVYNVEDTPICFGSHSPLSNLAANEAEGEENAVRHHKDSIAELKELKDTEEDKFDLNSGLVTPSHTYLSTKESICQETPLVFSRHSTPSSLSEVDPPSPHSEVASDPGSRLVSGWATPSDLPDSPGQSMPVSRNRSLTNIYEASTSKAHFPLPNQSKPLQAQPNPQLLAHQAQVRAAAEAKPPNFGYVTTLPASDEVKKYDVEQAMSEMTSFSGLTIDDHKVAPIGRVKELPKIEDVKEDQRSADAPQGEDGKDIKDVGSWAIKQAGYLTSLPTNDEIKLFTNEDGTMSPGTTFSEISALKLHNEGFQRGSKNSFASRSSATGASVPKPAPASSAKQQDSTEKTPASEKGVASKSPPAAASANPAGDKADPLDDFDSFDDSSDDDEDAEMMLQQCIIFGEKENKSRSHSSKQPKNTSSSRSKDKHYGSKKISSQVKAKPEPVQVKQAQVKQAPVKQAPVRKFNLKESLASANKRLNGIKIEDYIESKMKITDVDTEEEKTPSSTTKPNPTDAGNSPENRGMTGRDVIKTVETLNETYSVKKQLKSNEKCPKDGPAPPQADVPPHHVKVQAFLQAAPRAYAVEGTPVEMSRCTSLSNITVDSGPDNCDFSALQRKVAEKEELTGTSQNNNTPADHPKAPALSKRPSKDQASPVSASQDQASSKQTDSTSFSDLKAKDSQEILDTLSTQIEKMTVTTLTSPTGYVTSLPHSDEIKKFQVEGSIGAHTNFSALTIDSNTKIKPLGEIGCQPLTENSDPKQPTVPAKKQARPSAAPGDAHENASRHYGEDRTPMRDGLRPYEIEDTPLVLSGNNSSLSSIDIESDSDANLLNDCISSAMPVARRDPAAALPPNQLALYQQQQFLDNMNRNQIANQQHQARNAWDYAPQGQSQLPKDTQLDAISPLSLVSLSSPDQPSTGFTVSSASNVRSGDSYYRLSRQPSISESLNSEGSLALGGDAASLMKDKNPGRPKIVKKSEGSSEGKTPTVRGGKKVYRSHLTGKPRQSLRCEGHAKDPYSSESSDTRKVTNSSRTRTAKTPCKCHPPSRSRQLPQSSSMGKLAESPSGRIPRKPAASVYSKPVRECGHDMRKPGRLRTHSGVTQHYPPIKQIGSVTMQGVCTLAARGDVVMLPFTVAEPSGSTRPMILKQDTFIQDEPSPALLESVARQQQQQNQGNKPKKAAGKKTADGKGSNVWKGLKKLLSPSDETKGVQTPPDTPKGKASSSKTKVAKTDIDSNTWTKSKGQKKAKTPSKSPREPAKSKSAEAIKQSSNLSLSSSQTSSLSLTSSSSNESAGGLVDPYKAQTPKKSIYPTERSINPARHVPKSPSPRNRYIVGKSPPTKARSSWNRTPTPDGKKKVPVGGRKVSLESSSSATSVSLDCRRSSKSTSVSSKSRVGSQASVAEKSRIRSSPGQGDQARSLHVEVAANSTRVNLAEGNSRFAQKVVQEVAPFNYRPHPNYSEHLRSDANPTEVFRTGANPSESRRVYPVTAEVYRSQESDYKMDAERKQTEV